MRETVVGEMMVVTVAARVTLRREEREARQMQQPVECGFDGFETVGTDDGSDLFHDSVAVRWS